MVTTRASAFVGLHYLIYGNIMAARFPNEFFNTPDAKPESITMATQISHRAAAGVALALVRLLRGAASAAPLLTHAPLFPRRCSACPADTARASRRWFNCRLLVGWGASWRPSGRRS